MGALSYIACALLAAGLNIGVNVSPDQPLPYGYIDDPLVVELSSEQDATASLTLSIDAGAKDAAPLKAGPLALRAKAPGLAAFAGLPAQRGILHAKLGISTGADNQEVEISVARIERPAADADTLPIFVHSVENMEQIIAARAAGAAAVRLGVDAPNLGALVRAAAPMGVILHVAADQQELIPKAIAQIPADLLHVVVRWTVDAGDKLATLQAVADAIRATPCKAPISVVVTDAASFERLMNEGAGKSAHAAVLLSDVTTGKEARLLLDAAERSGHEGWPLYVIASGAGGAQAPSHAMQQVIANLAAGATSTGLSAGLLYDAQKNAMGEAFVALAGLGRRLEAREHAGNLNLATSVSAPLFRDGADWVLALWSEGAAKEVPVPVNGATGLSLTDAWGNPVPLPEVKEGALPVATGAMPVLLTGTGGDLLTDAARNKAVNTARRLLDEKDLQRWIAPELRTLAQAVVDRKGELDRPSTLALLRMLPEMEKQWHAGKLPRSAAVPVIADIAHLCRQLATVEQGKGQPYLEPLHDMIARSEEMQSVYLTGAGGGPEAHERGDWILNEVRRLIDEAKKLSDADRKIEAAGLAALAEWRARGLEHAAQEGDKSRLSEDQIAGAAPAPVPAPAPAPPAKAEEKPKADEKAKAEEAAKAEEKSKAEEKAKAEEKLKADEKPEPGQPKGTRKLIHTVERGDTPESIAKKYGADLEEFRKLNGLRRDAQLKPGKQYTVYAPAKEAPKADAKKEEAKKNEAKAEDAPGGTKKITHTIAKGDNPSTIAKKYGVKTEDFLKWNKLQPNARFQIGEEYVVYVPAKR